MYYLFNPSLLVIENISWYFCVTLRCFWAPVLFISVTIPQVGYFLWKCPSISSFFLAEITHYPEHF